MNYIAHIEKETNRLIGFNVYNAPNNETVSIDESVWREALKINANCYEDGRFIVKDFRTNEEIIEQELRVKINEANQYLAQTDWVNSYKIRHDLGLELILEESSKWFIINKREEYITFLKGAK